MYRITLNNGDKIRTDKKPELKFDGRWLKITGIIGMREILVPMTSIRKIEEMEENV